MSELRFDGQGAGLGRRQGGDANSAADYTVICTCKTELGPLAGFFPNAQGQRTILCPICDHVTIVKDGRIAGYVKAPPEILAKAAEMKVAKENALRQQAKKAG